MPNPLDEFYVIDTTLDSEVKSPCVRNCCLDNDDICVGCNRTLDEILAWGNASHEEKKQILKSSHDRFDVNQVATNVAF